MKFPEQSWSRWLAWLDTFSLRRTDLWLGVLVTILGLTLFELSGAGYNSQAGFVFLQNIEQRSLDLRFGLRGQRAHDDRVVIVDIDEKTLQKIGSFPFPRKSYAKLIDRLSAGRASAIALDITFPTPETDSAQQALQELQQEMGSSASASVLQEMKELEKASDQDAQLARALKNSGNVVLGHIFLDTKSETPADAELAKEYFDIAWAKAFPQVLKVNSKGGVDFKVDDAWRDHGGRVYSKVEANMAKLASAADSFGFLNIQPDSDGTLRHAWLIVRYEDQDFFPSLALQVVREFEKIPDQDVAAFIAPNGLERIQLGRHLLWPARNGDVLINYTGPYGTYQHYSMWDVMNGSVPAETFRGKMVLVGATALGIGDIRNTPFEGVYMGVEVHANIIDNLLHSGERGRTFLTRGFYERMIDRGFILVFGLVFGFLFSRITPLFSTISMLVALALFGWCVYFIFADLGRWLSFVIPAGTLAANYASITSFRMIFEEREKRKIRKTFSQYLSPGVIKLIEKDPQKYIRPGGEMKELTVMFSDIRGFTTISEGLTPDELVQLLNEYLGEMTDIVFATNGTLDKYIGDAIMAFWGSPYPQDDHAFRGCSCALRMIARLEALNAKWKSEGRKAISIGIGLNAGPVNVGNMGSAKRLAWTVMGDNVNLASRLEGINKEYHTQIVINETTYRQVANQFVCRDLDKIRVKGKNLPVNIYELLGVASDRPKFAPMLEEFDRAMASYRSQDWQGAATKFGNLLKAHPDDGPSRVFLERSLDFLKHAPEGQWDGVYVMKTK